MPSIRKDIFNRIAEDLLMQARKADRDLWDNKYKLKQLSTQQRELKQKRAELHRLYNEFTGKPK